MHIRIISSLHYNKNIPAKGTVYCFFIDTQTKGDIYGFHKKKSQETTAG